MWAAALTGHIVALNVLIRAKADVNTANEVSLIFILHEIILWYNYTELYYLLGKSKQKSLYYLLHVCVSIPTIIGSEILY